jgi:integrase
MPKKLTDTVVRDLKAPAAGNSITYDTEVKGFGVRVTAQRVVVKNGKPKVTGGARSYILNYRADGIERRYTIGSSPDWKTGAAREEAKALKKRIDRGEDPMADRHTAREAPTMADLAALYREQHLPRKREGSREGDEILLRKHVLPNLGNRRVAAIRHTDVAALHRDITKSTPIAANRCIALLSKMFAIAIKEEWRSDNPAKGVERNPENKRERYLTPAEIARLSEVLANHPEKASANAVRLLLLTGARRSEVLGATWDQFDLEVGAWVRPAHLTKQAKTHRIPLSAPALALLVGMKAEIDSINEKRRLKT